MRILIPVKPLADAKTRLAGVLSPAGRAEVMLALMDHVLRAALATAPVSVVTADPEVAGKARAMGAAVIAETRAAGLDAAVRRGAARFSEDGETAMFVLAADLPEVTPRSIQAMAALWRPGAAVIAPSADGGTNALILAPAAPFAFAYGPDSFARHRAAAARAALEVRVYDDPALGRDLDRPEDLASWAGRGRVGGPAD